MFGVAITVSGLSGCTRPAPERPTRTSIDPLSQKIMTAIATAQSAGEYAGAAVLLDSLSARLPRDAAVEFLRGVQFEETGFRSEAIEAYKRSRDIDPEFPGAWHNLGRVYALTHSYRDALSAFQQAVRLQPVPGALQGVGNAWFELGETDSAEVALQRALEMDSQHVASRLALANVLEKKGDADAIEHILAPCGATSYDSECAKEFAMQLIRAGKTGAAVDSLELILPERPWDKEVFFALAQALAAEGRNAEAEEARTRFSEIEATDADIFRLQERISLSPESLRERLELADRYRNLGRTMDAARTLSAALVLAPNNLNIRNNIGLLLLNSNQAEAAAQQFQFIIRMDSTSIAAKSNLAKAAAQLAGQQPRQ